MATCIACQHVNLDGAGRCAHCDARLAQEQVAADPAEIDERRYLTVLFCDLVGSSSLAEDLGPDDYAEVVGVVHQTSATIVENAGGQVSQYLGDGVLALFGYPLANEDDAARAVEAALAMQAAIPACTARVRRRVAGFDRDLHSRAAIHTGLVVIREVGAGRQRRILALGDAVNVASRLQDLAPADSLLVTAATRRLLGEQFELQSRGDVSVRGIRTPIETFRVARVRPAGLTHDAARRGELTPMVGRAGELECLLDRWQKVEAGQGQVVVVSGEAGIGKSRLLGAAKRGLELGTRWLDLRGSAYHQTSELRPVLDLLERRVLQGATGPAARLRLQQVLREAGLEADDSLRLLAPLLALPPPQDEQPLPLMPAEQRRRIIEEITEWVWRLAAHAPIVVALEDLQWVDPTSMDLLCRLVAALHDRRVLLLLTCRTPFEPPWERQTNEERLTLEPLTRADAQRLVESIAAQRTPNEDVMRDVLAKSDGVPLFLEEVARMLLDVPGAIESVPETLRGLLAARLDRLPPQVVDTTRLGAVIGRHFSRELLCAVSSKGTAAIDEDLAILLDSGVLVRESHGYVFKHVLLRDAAYERMLRSARATVHGAVATTLLERFPYLAETQPALVAHHFTEAGDTATAVQAWSRAGARSLRHGAYLEAVDHLRRALALLEQLPESTQSERSAHSQDELRLRRDLGVGLIATQGYTSPAVSENYQRALQRSSELDDTEDAVPIHVLYGLWGTSLVRGDRAATDEFARHFRRVAQSRDPLARHVAHSTLAALAFYRGEFSKALAHCEEAMQLYEPVQHFVLMRDYGYEGGIYSHLYAACILCFTGFPDRAEALANAALGVADSIGDPYTKAVSLGFGACVARERGEPDRARAMSDDLVALATRHQFVFWLGIAHCLRGWSRLKQGDIQNGAEEIRSGLGIWESTGARVPGTYLRLNLIEAALAGGDIDGGLAAVEQGLYQCRTTLESYQEPEYHRLKGELLRCIGDVDTAEREMWQAIHDAREQGAAWVELRAALSLTRLLDARGAHDAVAPLQEAMSRVAEGAGTPQMLQARERLSGEREPLSGAR